MFPGQCGNTAFFFKSQPDQFHFEFRGIVFPGKSFFSAHEVSTCKISGCLSYRILDSGPDGTQTTLTYTFTKDQIEEELLFIPEGGMPDMQVLTWDGQLLALELPQTVDLEIVETSPGIKGASASARNKPATLSTGLVIQVPEYLSAGEKIRIHIEERRYMGRAD